MLNKPKIQNSAEIRETFGDLKKKQFRIPKDCEAGKGPTVGNARCYAAVSFIFDFRFTFCLIDEKVKNKDHSQKILCRHLF